MDIYTEQIYMFYYKISVVISFFPIFVLYDSLCWTIFRINMEYICRWKFAKKTETIQQA